MNIPNFCPAARTQIDRSKVPDSFNAAFYSFIKDFFRNVCGGGDYHNVNFVCGKVIFKGSYVKDRDSADLHSVEHEVVVENSVDEKAVGVEIFKADYCAAKVSRTDYDHMVFFFDSEKSGKPFFKGIRMIVFNAAASEEILPYLCAGVADSFASSPEVTVCFPSASMMQMWR